MHPVSEASQRFKRFQKSKLQWKYLIFTVTLVVIITADQVTKTAIRESYQLGETLSIISDFFNLTYVQNTGAAFGFLAHTPASFRVPFFLIIPVIALLSIGSIFLKIPEQDRKFAGALSLVISGALGNLIDRLRFGYVIDFLDFHWGWQYHFPAFNVADSAICIGVAILMLDLLLQQKPGGTEKHVSHSP